MKDVSTKKGDGNQQKLNAEVDYLFKDHKNQSVAEAIHESNEYCLSVASNDDVDLTATELEERTGLCTTSVR